MTVSNINVLDILGKQISFQYSIKTEISDNLSITYTEKFSGKVTGVCIGLDHEPEFIIDDSSDYYSFSEVHNFVLIQ